MAEKISQDEVSARGGRSRSPAKLEAIRKNLERAKQMLNARRAARTQSADKGRELRAPDVRVIPPTRIASRGTFVVFGKLKDCADAVAGCLSRKPKLPRASRLRIEAIQCDPSVIDCHDFCF